MVKMNKLDEILSKVINSEAKVILLDGGVGIGKSTIARRAIHHYLVNNQNKIASMVVRNRDNLDLDGYVDTVKKFYNYNDLIEDRLEQYIRYPNGSRLFFYKPYIFKHGVVHRSNKILLDNADDLDFEIYAEAQRRHGQVIVSCVPPLIEYPQQHWIYKHLILMNIAERYNWSYSDIGDNLDSAYIVHLQKLEDKVKKRLYLGDWQDATT